MSLPNDFLHGLDLAIIFAYYSITVI